MGEKQEWASLKTMVSKMDFITKLQTFDRENIAKKTLIQLRKQIAANPDFTPDNVKRVDGASASLCKWVLAMDKFAKVSEEVAPKKAQLEIMNAKMDEAQAKLKVQ